MPRRALFRFLLRSYVIHEDNNITVLMPRRALFRFLHSHRERHRNPRDCVNAPEGFVSISTVPLTKIPDYIWILEGCIFDNKSGQYTLSIFFVLLTF